LAPPGLRVSPWRWRHQFTENEYAEPGSHQKGREKIGPAAQHAEEWFEFLKYARNRAAPAILSGAESVTAVALGRGNNDELAADLLSRSIPCAA